MRGHEHKLFKKRFFTAPCFSNGAVMPSYDVCLSVCDVGGL